LDALPLVSMHSRLKAAFSIPLLLKKN